MTMHIPVDPASKKAYEISYALFRVTAVMQSRAFVEILEKEALTLLHATASELKADATRSIRSLGLLLLFAKDTGRLQPESHNLFVQQLDALDALLVDIPASSGMSFAELESMFSRVEAEDSSEPEDQELRYKNKISQGNNPTNSLEERQDIILQTIRQSGNCRSRDLQAVLPDLSERTLRYNLQKLIEEGKIERHGAGGPASWYKVVEGRGGSYPQSA